MYHAATASSGPGSLHYTLGRNPLDERSARRRDLYQTTHKLTTDIHALDGIRTDDSSKRATAEPEPWNESSRGRGVQSRSGQLKERKVSCTCQDFNTPAFRSRSFPNALPADVSLNVRGEVSRQHKQQIALHIRRLKFHVLR